MPRSGFSPSRVAPVGRSSRRVLAGQPAAAERRPRQQPEPVVDAQAGTISHSISRTSRLYCGCSVTGAASPRSSARSHGLAAAASR